MSNLIETQRVYKILKKVIKRLEGQSLYEDKYYKAVKTGNVYTIITHQGKHMTITHDERSVSWAVPDGVSVLSIQQQVL